MTTTIVAPYVVAAAGVVLLGLRLRFGARRPAESVLSMEQILAAAPIELRPAVAVFAHPALTNAMLEAVGLGSLEKGYPLLDRYDYAPHGLTADFLIRSGQSRKDWINDQTLDRFAQHLGVEKVTALCPEPGWVRLQVRVFDVLADPVAVPGLVADGVDLEAVPVGVREDGDLWLLKVLYAHILLAGATGSGKGSVLWSIIGGVGPAIKAGLVDVWMADPKGGMEFGRGERLWVRFQWTAEGIIGMLNEAVGVMHERAARLRQAGVRKHTPTTDEPLILIVIDEAAALSAYATREEAQEFSRLLGLLLSQGRALAVSVVAAVQDPSKETLPNRQLFPVRVGLRLDESNQTVMVHGQGSRDRGARCDEIPDTTPGVGYVGEDGSSDFVRVRAFWVSDDDADTIVDTYAPEPVIVSVATDSTDDDFDPATFDPDDLGDEDGKVAA